MKQIMLLLILNLFMQNYLNAADNKKFNKYNMIAAMGIVGCHAGCVYALSSQKDSTAAKTIKENFVMISHIMLLLKRLG